MSNINSYASETSSIDDIKREKIHSSQNDQKDTKTFKGQIKTEDNISKSSEPSCLIEVRKHTDSFSCETCPKAFLDKDNLEKHRKVHQGGKILQGIKKLFKKSNPMKQPGNTKKYKVLVACDICPETFLDKERLKNYMEVHQGRKLLQYEEKTFPRDQYLPTKLNSEESLSLSWNRNKTKGQKLYRHLHSISSIMNFQCIFNI